MARISRNQSGRDNRSDSRKGSFDKKSGNKPRPAGRSFDKSGLSRKKDGDERPRYSERSNSGKPAPDGFRKRREGAASRIESKGEKKNFRPGPPYRRDSAEGKVRSPRREPSEKFQKKPEGDRTGGGAPPDSRSKYQRKEFSDKDRPKRPFQKARGDKQKRNPSTPIPDAASGGLIRLNRYISNSGVCSRREADELIKLGVITVNGTTITELGHKVNITDDVRHEGKRLRAQKPVYLLLNKPKGYITTTDDPEERNTVMQLIQGACKERVYPVGRLDRNTSGLLLLTNDGELTDKLTHPSHNVKKIYKAELDRPLTKNDFQKILDGVYFETGCL